MKYASIDIGTNTILMLIGEIDDSLKIIPVEDFYEVPRLGKNVSVTKELSSTSIERALKVLRNYRVIADDYGVERIVASATSAVREAINGKEFVKQVEDETGIDVEIIDGETEANVGFIGAVSGAPNPDLPTLVIDIGGGSTELSYGTGMRTSFAESIDIGAVRITEKFLHHTPPNPSELNQTVEFIRDGLRQFPFDKIIPRVVFGVAGTATTLALIAQNRYDFDAGAVTNFVMTVENVQRVFDLIKTKSTDEILNLTKAAEGRADVLVAGTLILMEILTAAKANEFLTTDRGLRYGYLLYKHKQFLSK
jgi:exopolyphosphatase/guanosine-5'-triphosphate,3'-diphosphate pyrophosphatase